MPTRDPDALSARITELEHENRVLRERASWSALRLRATAEAMHGAIGELEQGLVAPPEFGATG